VERSMSSVARLGECSVGRRGKALARLGVVLVWVVRSVSVVTVMATPVFWVCRG